MIRLFLTTFIVLNFYPTLGSVLNKYIVSDVEEQWEDFWFEENSLIQREFKVEFPYEDCFREAAEEQKLPVSLVLAVARGESGFNPKAVSSADALGIMQILWPATAKELGFSSRNQLFEPCSNIRAGTRYLRQLIDMFNGNIYLATASYNYGPTNIKKQINKYNGRITNGAKGYSSYILYHLGRIKENYSDHIIAQNEKEKAGPIEKWELFTSKHYAQTMRIKGALEKHIKGINLYAYTNQIGLTTLIFINDDPNPIVRKDLKEN